MDNANEKKTEDVVNASARERGGDDESTGWKDVAERALDMLNARKETQDDSIEESTCEEDGARNSDDVSVLSILEDVSKRSKKFTLMTPGQLVAMGSASRRGKDPYQKHMLADSEDLLARSLYHCAWDDVLKQLLRNEKSDKREEVVGQLNELYGRGILENAELLTYVDAITLFGASENSKDVTSTSPRAKNMSRKGKDMLTTYQIVTREIRFILQSTEELRWVQYNTRKLIAKRLFTELPFIEEVKKIHDWAQGHMTNLSAFKVSYNLIGRICMRNVLNACCSCMRCGHT